MEVGALQRVQGVTDTGLNLDQNHPLKMVMNGAACCHPLRSFWAMQRKKMRTKTGESTSSSNEDLLWDEIDTPYLVGSKVKLIMCLCYSTTFKP